MLALCVCVRAGANKNWLSHSYGNGKTSDKISAVRFMICAKICQFHLKILILWLGTHTITRVSTFAIKRVGLGLIAGKRGWPTITSNDHSHVPWNFRRLILDDIYTYHQNKHYTFIANKPNGHTTPIILFKPIGIRQWAI